MDRLKMQIPRSLLDLFLDYSVNNKLFDKKLKEEITFKNDDYDNDKFEDPLGDEIQKVVIAAMQTPKIEGEERE